MKQKDITTNYIYNLAYQIITIIIPLCLTPYLTRVLGPDNLGIFSYTSSYVILFISVASLGLNLYGQREIAYCQNDVLKRSKLFWELIIIRVIATFIVLIGYIYLIFMSSKYRMLYFLFLPYLLSNMIDITWLFQGIENFKIVSFKLLIIKILYMVSVFIFIKNINDLKLYILIFSLTFFIQYLLFWFGIKKYIIKVKISSLNIKRHYKNVIIFFIPQIATTIYTIMDRSMIGLLTKKMDSVYYYEQASYLVKTLVIFITTFGTVMLSKSSKLFAQKKFNEVKDDLNAIINFVWLFGCALFFGIYGIIAKMIPWFYGQNYSMIKILVYIMAILIIILGLSNIIGIQILVPIKRQSKYTLAIVIGMIVNFVLNYILISRIGAIGAAISSVVGETIVLFIELYFVKDIIRFRDLIKCAPKYICYGITMFLVVNIIGYYMSSNIISSIIQILIGMIIYCMLLLVFKDKFIYKYVIGYIKKLRSKHYEKK